jgi:hypothetical protein
MQEMNAAKNLRMQLRMQTSWGESKNKTAEKKMRKMATAYMSHDDLHIAWLEGERRMD